MFGLAKVNAPRKVIGLEGFDLARDRRFDLGVLGARHRCCDEDGNRHNKTQQKNAASKALPFVQD